MRSVNSAKTATVVGVGLIGGSVALVLRRLGWYVIGVDNDETRAREALAAGVVDEMGEMRPCDLAVIATPVNSIAELAQAALDAGAGVVTDVGSVKAPIAAEVTDGRFVAGHPIAGSEQDGVFGASADMFSGAAWVLCPTAVTDDAAFSQVKEIVTAAGAQVMVVSPERHDRLVAVVSHVPHLTAATLMRVAVGRTEQQNGLLRFAAGGFRDMTRIAAGQPTIWPAICAQNSNAIIGVLDDLISELASLREIVADGDELQLLAHLEGARVARRNLPTTAPDTEALSEMRVPVLDRPGELAAIAMLATELDVNIYDLEIAHSPEGPRGVVVLLVESETAERLQIALSEQGYRPSIQPLG
ncbi:MAG: prephenate dehydrogenase/arogenate dehydrogenase family protein [Acidimicrobiaceae bacterium]|nr:prephenate dehydrogenase/arogenate dehydrogenase family protein [Acidimicrobiaceae bacterium]MXW74749.1 prephenate dehydrogenase/arogenate dehydrogenase family protein [Acidimicrobiaceae bacterium]MYA73466.1 prephenate dehydrogenase/arogenate dehydrogenase family protein [Acidimicrobiaceae bacterium]MYC42058.1 prephenate dehydrogenase/arogenate dehydrogenase family protein [Acidimicrobiaceae bacterium]MYD07980.1 prephenate dehydrogenase/arogenate dehydrogenase family protein [Acidimicrobiace